MRLRSVELELPDLARTADFLSGAWGLLPAGSSGGTQFFRGTGNHPYILSITRASAPRSHGNYVFRFGARAGENCQPKHHL